MSEMVIEKAMVIDDVECVIAMLTSLTGRKVIDLEIIKKYICTERNTKFYVDRKLKSRVNYDSDALYLWLDTGYRDQNNKTIFISLVNNGREYKGHYVGNAQNLANRMKDFLPAYRRNINTNYSRFLNKYKQKAAEREHEYIVDENKYLFSKSNCEDSLGCSLAVKIQQLDVIWEKDEQDEFKENENVQPKTEEKMSEYEEKITVGILFDILQEREQYIQELLRALEKNRSERDAEIKKLIDTIKKQSITIKERTDALTDIRIFTEKETSIQFQRDMTKECREKGKTGHNLLKNSRKKILVLGTTNLSVEVMKGIISKEYGFEEGDFEYETDYHKVVHSSGRIMSSSKYQAIIFGCCPHSVTGKGKWSGLIERCKQEQEICVVDARNISGKLKVTKASFRNALNEVCEMISSAA